MSLDNSDKTVDHYEHFFVFLQSLTLVLLINALYIPKNLMKKEKAFFPFLAVLHFKHRCMLSAKILVSIFTFCKQMRMSIRPI